MTKADFYIGTGVAANWIGSIFNDGYVHGIPLDILICVNPTLYEELVVEFIQAMEGVVKTNGDKWPWLWPDSRMTDYSYIFIKNLSKVVASHYGGIMFDPIKHLNEGDMVSADVGLGKPVFPLTEGRSWTKSCQNYTETMASIRTIVTSR
jgi:hypothetical protein